MNVLKSEHRQTVDEHYFVVSGKLDNDEGFTYYYLAPNERTARDATEFLKDIRNKPTQLTQETVTQALLNKFPQLEYKEETIKKLLPTHAETLKKQAEQHLTHERNTQREILKSTAYEGVSNLPLIFMAASTGRYREAGAVLVYSSLVFVPLAYDYIVSKSRERKISHALSVHASKPGARAFDTLGLTLEGKVSEHTKHHWAAEPFYDVLRLLPNTKALKLSKNPHDYGLIGSVLRYSYLNARSAVKYVKNQTLSKNYQQHASNQNTPEEAMEELPRSDLRTRMTEIRHVGAIHVPTNPTRLKAANKSTRLSIRSDRVKIGLNLLAMYGIGEFCYGTAIKTHDYAQIVLQSPSLANITTTAVWGASCILGAAASLHFFEDRETIDQELNSKQAILSTKEERRIDILNIRSQIEQKLSDLEHITEDERQPLRDEILKLADKVDIKALDIDTRRAIIEIRYGDDVFEETVHEDEQGLENPQLGL